MSTTNAGFSTAALSANTADKQKLSGYIEEITNYSKEIKAARDAIGDITRDAKDTLGIPPKLLRAMVRENMSEGVLKDQIDTCEDAKEALEIIGAK